MAIGVTNPIPGTIGLVPDEHTLLYVPFAEDSSQFPPRDVLGNLGTIGAQAGAVPLTSLPVVDAYCGRGRRVAFADTAGFEAVDASGRDTLTTRDATVQAIVSFDATAANTDAALYTRGRGSSFGAAEYRSLSVELRLPPGIPIPGAQRELTCRWQTGSGVSVAALGVVFPYPAAGSFVLLTVTRRWETPTRVIVRYYLNDELLKETVSTNGDIAGSTTAGTTIGARYNDTGARFGAWPGTIDELLVADREMSAEEVRAVWQRLTVYQPSGVALLTAMAPPGSNWGTDPSSNISRLMRIGGTALGYARARAQELVETWLPDRAYADDLQRWERLFGVSAKPLESLDVRRQRVVGAASRENGYAATQITAALAPLLGTAASNLQILEFTNRIDEDFATWKPERWHTEPAAQWTVSASVLTGSITVATDARIDAERHNHVRAITSMSSGAGRVVVLAKITASTGTDVLSGLHLWNGRRREGIWFGSIISEPNRLFRYATLKGGVVSGAISLVGTVGAALPFWLRLTRIADGSWSLGWSTTSAEAGFTEAVITGLPTDLDWAGLAMLGLDASADSASIQCDDFTLITPEGTRANTWYVYRDPALPGSPDIVGANALLQRLKPAHTHAAVITSRSLLCDSTADGGCDRGPMGAL